MQIADEAELWALFRAIMECKFGEHSCSLELAGSTPLAHVIDRMWLAFQQTRLYTIAAPAGGWDQHRQLNPQRMEWNRIITWIRATKSWNKWSIEQKREYVRILSLPYIVAAEHEPELLSI